MISIPTSALRRAGGRTVLQTAADLGVALSLLFWLLVFGTILLPRVWPVDVGGLLTASLIVLFIAALSLCMAFVVPALASMLLPGTAAGMYLQEHQRRTLGFVVLVPATLFLIYTSWYLLAAWWAAQPTVGESGLVTQFSVVSLIFFVVVPSWAWSSSSPALRMTEVEQAQAVKRLKLSHEAELALFKANFARALGLMQLGLDNCTVEQRQYVADVIYGMHRWRNEQLRQVSQHLGTLMGVEEGLPWQDGAMLQQLETVRQAVTTNSITVPDDVPAVRDVTIPDRSQIIRDDMPRTGTTERLDTATAETALQAARLVGCDDWTVRALADRLGGAESTVRKDLAVWREWGWVEPGALNGRYRFTAAIAADAARQS
jgi:hypothetical protein